MEIIAHRGASFDAPENTRAAIQLAWEQGVDGVEVDIHLSRDGQIVVIHDDDTRRTTGKQGLVSDQTLAELKQLDAGSWRGTEWVGQPIPTLEELLPSIPHGKRLILEIKTGVEILPPLKDLLDRTATRPDGVALISFMPSVVIEAKRSFPEVPVYWIIQFESSPNTPSGWQPVTEELIGRCLAAKADGLDVSAEGPLNKEFANKVHEAGLGLYVWTVDDVNRALGLKAAGVDGIASNRPVWLLEQLAQQALR